MIVTAERDLSCKAVMWSHDRLCLSFDEQYAFLYEVREHGIVIGYINTDRARTHPEVMWKRSLLRDGKIEGLAGAFKTAEEALAAF